MDEEPVGLLFREHAVDFREQPGGQPIQGLIRPHEVQIEVGREPEEAEDLVQKLPVLRRGAKRDLEALRLPPQPLNDRHHLDGLGPGSRHR